MVRANSYVVLGTAMVIVSSLAACGDDKEDVDTKTSTYAGHVYAATNAAGGNAVVHYGRKDDGALVMLETTSTGGNGVGGAVVLAGAPSPQAVDPLFSQDSLVLSSDHTRLFVVNAGSDSMTSFRVDDDGMLTVAATITTGGKTPTSIATHGDLVYVSHATTAVGSTNQIFGFRVDSNGGLTAIANASYAPSAATIITQALFSPDGQHLAVVELMHDVIDVFPVAADGTLGTPVRNASAAPGPFSALFLADDRIVVTEVHTPADVNAGSISTYSLSAGGVMSVIAADVGNNQNATCWLAATPDRKFVYASNTSSSDVSSYSLSSNGTPALLNGAAATRVAAGATDFMGNPTSGPVDLVISADGKYLYQQFSGLGIIAGFSIGTSGDLVALANGDTSGLPALGSEGIDGY